MAKELGELMPEMIGKFGESGEALFKESDLDEKTIELVILAFGIAHQCDGCIDHHVGKLVELDATENEIATIAACATLMGGGPGSAYGGKALAAYYEKKGE